MYLTFLSATGTVTGSRYLVEASGKRVLLDCGLYQGVRELRERNWQAFPVPPRSIDAVLLVGYQGEGTRGRLLLDGAKELRLFKEDVPVRAEVVNVDAFSAHADVDELIEWLRSLPRPPKQVFLIHGEDPARHALAARIRNEIGWDATVPGYGDRVTLS